MLPPPEKETKRAMPDINDFPPEVIEQAKRLLEAKERLLDAKRNLPSAAYPAQLRGIIEQLIIAFELAVFGKVTDPGSNQMVGMSVGAPDGGQRVQIFMPTPTASVPLPEQPPIEIIRSPAAPPPTVVAAPPASALSVNAAMEAIARAPSPVPVPAAPSQIIGSIPVRSGLDPQAAAAMEALARSKPPAPVAAAPGMTVEIFPAGDPRAPAPSKAG